MYRVALFIVALILLIGGLLPFVQVAVWSGHFELAVHVAANPTVDVHSIRFIEIWNREMAEFLLKSPTRDRVELDFEIKKNGRFVLQISCGGKNGFFDLMDTYHQPDSLVVEFTRHTEDGPQVARKLLPIPAGRGARSVNLSLP
jgi:hypothetical protein